MDENCYRLTLIATIESNQSKFICTTINIVSTKSFKNLYSEFHTWSYDIINVQRETPRFCSGSYVTCMFANAKNIFTLFVLYLLKWQSI